MPKLRVSDVQLAPLNEASSEGGWRGEVHVKDVLFFGFSDILALKENGLLGIIDVLK